MQLTTNDIFEIERIFLRKKQTKDTKLLKKCFDDMIYWQRECKLGDVKNWEKITKKQK